MSAPDSGYSLDNIPPAVPSSFAVAGRLVRTLVDGGQTAGRKFASWDGTDAAGARVSSGIYLYRLETPDGAFTSKMLLLK